MWTGPSPWEGGFGVGGSMPPGGFHLSGSRACRTIRDERLQSSWPLSEQPCYFDLGHILNCAISDAIEPAYVGALGIHHAGLWECNLKDNTLIWSGGVYDLFGLERGSPISRSQALALYSEHSRACMERLRAEAINDKKGFIVDVEIREASVRENRWVRIIGTPVCEGDDVIGLQGLKMAI